MSIFFVKKYMKKYFLICYCNCFQKHFFTVQNGKKDIFLWIFTKNDFVFYYHNFFGWNLLFKPWMITKMYIKVWDKKMYEKNVQKCPKSKNVQKMSKKKFIVINWKLFFWWPHDNFSLWSQMKKFPKLFWGILKMDIQNVQKRKAKNTFGNFLKNIKKQGFFGLFFEFIV